MANFVYNTVYLKGSVKEIRNFIAAGMEKNGVIYPGDNVAIEAVLVAAEGAELSMDTYVPMPRTYKEWDTTNNMRSFYMWIYSGCGNVSDEVNHIGIWDEVNKYAQEHKDEYPNAEDSSKYDEIAKILHPELIQAYEAYVKGYNNAVAEQKSRFKIVGWYDWSCKNWGTKWNAYFYDLEVKRKNGDEIIISFKMETAWTEPTAFFNKIRSRFPKIKLYACGVEESFNFIYTYDASQMWLEEIKPFDSPLYNEIKSKQDSNDEDEYDFGIAEEVTNKIITEFVEGKVLEIHGQEKEA